MQIKLFFILIQLEKEITDLVVDQDIDRLHTITLESRNEFTNISAPCQTVLERLE